MDGVRVREEINRSAESHIWNVRESRAWPQ